MVTQNDHANKIIVKAMLSGVFYRRPAPEEPPYIEIGDVVEKNQVLGLIESMKVFNKLKSPAKGRVIEIVAEHDSVVDTGATVMILEPL